MKMTYAVLVLRTEGTAYPVTLKLGEERLLHAEQCGRTQLDHIRREIDRKLKKALGRRVDFAFFMETLSKDGGREAPHLHGVLAVEPDEKESAKTVLIEVADDFDRARAVKFSEWTKRPLRWADYSTKQLFDPIARKWPHDFTMTADLLRRARARYEKERALFLEISNSEGRA